MSNHPHPLGLKSTPATDMSALEAAASALGQLIGAGRWEDLDLPARDQLTLMAGTVLTAYRQAGGPFA